MDKIELAASRDALVAGILHDPSCLDEPWYSDTLVGDRALQVIRAVRAVRENGTADVAAVAGRLRSKDLLEQIGGEAYLAALLEGYQGKPWTEYAAKRIHAHMTRRSAASDARAAAEAIMDGEKPSLVIDLLEGARAVVEGEQVTTDPIVEIDMARLHEPLEPVPWVIEGLLAERDVLAIGGEPGGGKSMVALDLAVSLAGGGPFCSMHHVERRQKVLYVDEEMSHKLALRRLKLMLAGREEDGSCLDLRYLAENCINLDSEAGLARLRAVLDEYDPDFLVLDSLIRFHRRNENDNSEVSAFFGDILRPLRSEYGCGIITLNHMGKPSENRKDPLDRIRGASDLVAVTEQIWCVEGDRATSGRTLRFLRNRWDEQAPPMQLSYQKDDHQSRLTASSEASGGEETVRRVLEIAGAVGRLRREIVHTLAAEGYASADRVANSILGRLKSQGVVVTQKEGRNSRYWLADCVPNQGTM